MPRPKKKETLMPEAAKSVRVPVDLEPFEGTEVIAASIAITKAGDGLSEALSVAPQAFHLGEKLYVVLECDVAKIRYEDVKDTGSLRRQHTLEAKGATFVDASLVSDLVDAQKEAVQLAKEEAAGIQRLPLADEPEPDVSPLHKLSAQQLRDLCAANAIDHPKKATKERLVELLAEVPGIMEAAASFDQVPDSNGEGTVTALADRTNED
jgi:hypothetical protein